MAPAALTTKILNLVQQAMNYKQLRRGANEGLCAKLCTLCSLDGIMILLYINIERTHANYFCSMVLKDQQEQLFTFFFIIYPYNQAETPGR
jgi:hypothetical protein